MPAKSKAQQRFMGMVRATQKGEEPASAKVAKAAQSMDPEDTEDFASTKHKGLPEKKKEEQKLREMIRDMIVVAESDLPITTKKGKTVTVVHKRSGKELVITDTPSARKKYKRMGYLVSEAKDIKGKDAGNYVKMAPKGRKITMKGKTYTSLGKGKWKGPKGEKLDWIEISSKASALGNKTVQYEATKINIDALLKNPKISKLLKKLSIVKIKSREDVVKVLNYFARNPHTLSVIKPLFGESVNEASPDKYTKGIQKIAKDNTLTFDDYDANDRPIFISSKNEEMEFTIDKKGNVWSHDGYRDKKIGNIRGYKNESINAAKASEIRKKLLKRFGKDPLYKDFIIARTPKEQKKALDTLKSIRGSNAIRLMQKYTKKLQRESINESREIGGYYMMKQLKDLARDAKRNRETKLHKAFMYLHARINQSYRDIDLNADDINDLLNEPQGRTHKSNIPTWMIDDLFEGKVNEAVQVNIDDLLKNPKVQKLLKTFGVKRDKNAIIKLLNYFAVNPSQLKRYGFA